MSISMDEIREKSKERIEKYKKALQDMPIYGITGEAVSCGKSAVATVKDMLACGIKIIQYREKDKSRLDQYEDCRIIKDMTKDAGALLIIDDAIDLALAVGADGVHIGQEDLPVRVARRLIGADMILGLSTSDEYELADANKLHDVIDYIGVGPVFPTDTKKIDDVAGLEYVKLAAKKSKLPAVAIGGIHGNNVQQVRDAGIKDVAVISALVGADDMKAAVQSLLADTRL